MMLLLLLQLLLQLLLLLLLCTYTAYGYMYMYVYMHDCSFKQQHAVTHELLRSAVADGRTGALGEDFGTDFGRAGDPEHG